VSGRPRAALIALALLVGMLSGCGGTPSPEQTKRVAFLKRYDQLNDRDLARLCPSLYPRDFLTSPKRYDKYGYTKPSKDAKTFRPTAAQRADARAAGCTSQGTPPIRRS
jgi:uncharacterized lipoprotein